MKLLFDENLSPRLVRSLSDIYPDSRHVHDLHLGGAMDSALWEHAKLLEFAVVSKDSDFAERSILEAKPPKVVWIQMGNCSTEEIEAALRTEHQSVKSFLENHGEVCLVLGKRKTSTGAKHL